MPEQYIANSADLTAVANAIRTKGGTTDTLIFPDGFVSAIGNLGSGEPVQPKDVNFIDYDGTVLHSYTVAEAATLTALPPLPSHDGLTCQGWNWSLADIKALGRAVTVGAMYITDDGKTRIYIHLEEGRTSPMLGCCPSGTVTVDWGDGTTADTLTGTSTSTVKWTPTHNYAAPGDYVIKLTVSGTMRLYGGNDSEERSGILRYSSSGDKRNMVYRNAVQKVEIGADVEALAACALGGCDNLSSVTIPDSITTINICALAGCGSLSAVVVPCGITTIEEAVLRSCDSLSRIAIPNSVTRLSKLAFQGCCLQRITIPDNVTTIGDSALSVCHSLSYIKMPKNISLIQESAFNGTSGAKCYDFTSAMAVPTLSSVSAFTDVWNPIAEDCEIRVPVALYEEWISATNWAELANHIVYVGTPYYLNVSSTDGGTVTPTGQVFAPPGCRRTLKIVPDDTHDLSDITLDGTSVKSTATYADASSNAWAVEAVDGASYGFALNTNGYYESQNKGKSSSAAVCKITITVPAETAISLDIINFGESSYDYGLLGAVDQVLTTARTADSGVAWSGKGKSSTNVVNVPFTIPAGTHYIYAKFIKDTSGDQGNDSLQFKVNLPTESFWAYTIENIQSDHDIVVTFGAKGA